MEEKTNSLPPAAALFVTAGLLWATDKKNKTQPVLYSSRVLWLPNRLPVLKRKYTITLSFTLF